LTLRAGRDAAIDWEARAALARTTGTPRTLVAPPAGRGFYGWDQLDAGTWIGAWIGIPRGRWEFEISADSRDAGWEGAAAVRFAGWKSGAPIA